MKYLSFKEAKTILYLIISGMSFVLILICIVLFNREKYSDLVLLLVGSSSLVLFVLIKLIKIQKIHNIQFDQNYVYIDSDKKKFKKADIKSIKYRLLTASYIDFNNNDRFYFLINQSEFLTHKLKKELIS